MKVNDEKEKMPVSRRLFVGKMGAFGLGAVGATSLLAACGSNNNNTSRQVGSIGLTSGELTRAFQSILTDEVAHVNFLKSAGATLGRPKFNVQGNLAVWNPADLPTFAQLSAALENTGTGAYLFQVTQPALLAAPTVLQAAGGIAIVEGRHAGFLNSLQDSAGKGQKPLLTNPADDTSPIANAVEVPQSPTTVLMRAAPFLGNYGQMAGQPLDTTDPNGNAIALPPGVSNNNASVVDILNYALFLEYLEATFYSINVPKFFGGGTPTF
ncbi:MAG: ferritin-like domain-containing protein [Armatimonadota bacterium]|nr:ferritin-like domain-containing protein [Armatimonadota bacterium]